MGWGRRLLGASTQIREVLELSEEVAVSLSGVGAAAVRSSNRIDDIPLARPVKLPVHILKAREEE